MLRPQNDFFNLERRESLNVHWNTCKPQADKKTTDDTARANAILNGKFNEKNGSGNFEVQIGAYSKPETVNELQIKLSGAGIKSHTQKIATTTGEVIRLRVGPFNSKESAEKAKAQIEKLGISAKIIPS